MNRAVIIVAIALIVIATVGGVAYYTSRPTSLSGDPWDYALTKADLSEGWEVGASKLETPYDIQREAQTPPAGLKSIYSVEYTHPTKVDVFDITSQVLLYDSTDSAQKALAAEDPGAEWERFRRRKTWAMKPGCGT